MNAPRLVQRSKLIGEINDDVHELKVAVETLKQYHQDDNNDDDDDKNEKADEGKDEEGKPNDDAGYKTSIQLTCLFCSDQLSCFHLGRY